MISLKGLVEKLEQKKGRRSSRERASSRKELALEDSSLAHSASSTALTNRPMFRPMTPQSSSRRIAVPLDLSRSKIKPTIEVETIDSPKKDLINLLNSQLFERRARTQKAENSNFFRPFK
eukprot:TRINITY_DN22012_c0_g1_i2.p2 TRINITY_DN22012_c0_g1~~TRINITY_DN22012_c0_g1_i2.p2  ORF type:complete len:120 (+),score=23.33 TRINITY_DN22012_c0_g1_i2:446-805(+)